MIMKTRFLVGVAAGICALLCASQHSARAAAAPLPSGIVSWWRGESNALDSIGTNNGTLVGNATYGTGEVGTAFVFDGNGDEVLIGNPANLQSQIFTVEMWVKRASASSATLEGGSYANLFGYGWHGYVVGINNNGNLYLSKCGVSEADSGSITDTAWHHLAVTYTNGAVSIYVDGVSSGAVNYGATFAFTNSAAIGRSVDSGGGFYGSIDEVSVYNRALAVSEIQAIYGAGPAGKNIPLLAPFYGRQPVSLATVNGATASFAVEASGTLPISYQWYFNATNILAGATNATLTINNVSISNVGAYSVIATTTIRLLAHDTSIKPAL